ncbi:hypothetical protein [Rubrolithibacter danxiaensis]|uniref:hypothetical protein n=1 Tax=Rubrolithibacter danxiaensis TaxID=3390805 RepID=UPI003BF80AA9
MTVKTQDQDLQLAQDLKVRNAEVDKAYRLITQSIKTLLSPFESMKYRTYIKIQHAKSDRNTNLVEEFICFFWNIILTTNRAGYRMLYFSYDEEALTRFGARLYNRALRHLFKHTSFDATKYNIEDCVRINNPTNIQSFFINRLANGMNDFISIDVQEKLDN